MQAVLKPVLSWIERCPGQTILIAAIVCLDLFLGVCFAGVAADRIRTKKGAVVDTVCGTVRTPADAKAMSLAAYRIQKPTGPTLVRVTCRMEHNQDEPSYYSIALLPYEDDPWAWVTAWIPRNSPDGIFFWELLKSGEQKKGNLILVPTAAGAEADGPAFSSYKIVKVIR
jgi:hypothetical protein